MIQEISQSTVLAFVMGGVNLMALIGVAGIVWKDGRWKGSVDTTLKTLCKKVDRIETVIFTGKLPEGEE